MDKGDRIWTDCHRITCLSSVYPIGFLYLFYRLFDLIDRFGSCDNCSSVIPSRYELIVFSRPSHNLRVAHIDRLPHSFVSASKHLTGAKSPSVMRSISPTVYWFCGRASLYPPCGPRTLCKSPYLLKREVICSRYFIEIACRSEISFNGINSSWLCCAKSIIKRSAYLPRVDIFIFSYRKTNISDYIGFVKKKGGKKPIHCTVKLRNCIFGKLSEFC